jgi:hypothetical protein
MERICVRRATRRGGRAYRVISEALEQRVFLSGETATAQLALVSTTGTSGNPTYNYDITLTNTGSTKIGTFWFAWLPGEDFLPTFPVSAGSPAGWNQPVEIGAGNSSDGVSIQWVAQSSATALASGHSLDGFIFSTHDSPATLAGSSPSNPGMPVLTSEIYIGGPETDNGFVFRVSPAATAAPGTIATTTGLTEAAPSINAGDSATFTATVMAAAATNSAPGGTVTFLDGGTTLGSATLQSNGSAIFSTTALPVGADSITARYGGDSNFTGSTSAAVTETVNSVVVPNPTPNPTPTGALKPTITRSTLPASVIAGTPVKGTVTVRVTNTSGTALNGKTTVKLVATVSGKVDALAIVLATTTQSVKLKTATSATVTFSIKSLPAKLTAGTYTLIAEATDPSAHAADSSTGPKLKVAAGVISLAGLFSGVSFPATAAPGKIKASASVKITNKGNIASSGATTVGLFLSTDGTVPVGARPLASITRSLSIAPGKSTVVSLVIGQIPQLAAGSYLIVAQIIDPHHAKTSVSGKSVNIT